MNKKIGALFVAVGVVASACGGSSESRTRNAVIERDVACFATEQDKTDTMNAMLQRKAEFEGDNQNRLAEQFNLVRARVDEVYARQLAHPEWETRLSGNLSDKGRKELDELSADYSAILKEYDALREAVWYTNISDGLAYYDAKYQRASETPVCESPSSSAAEESSTSSSSEVSDSSSSSSSTSSDSPETTNSVGGLASSLVASTTCPRPVITSPFLSRTSVGRPVTLGVSACNNYATEIRVQGPNDSPDRVRTSPQPGIGWNVIFADPGIYYVQIQFIDNGLPISNPSGVQIEVLENEADDPCAGKAPEVEIKLNGALSLAEVTSTCDSAQFAMLRLYKMNGDVPTEQVLSRVVTLGKFPTPEPLFVLVDVNPVGSYRLLTSHMDATNQRMPAAVGAITQTDFEITESQATTAQTDDPVVSIMPVSFFEQMEEPSEGGSGAATSSPASASAIAVPETVQALTCDQSCVDGLAKKAGVSSADVKTIEASVFDGSWFPLVVNIDIPLTGSVTNLAVRVTPKSGDPVVIGTSIHKGSIAEEAPVSTEGATSPAVYADSSNPGATFTVDPAEGSSFIGTNWWWIVLLVVLALAVLAYGARKRAADTRR